MSMLDTIANEMIITNLTQMTLRVSAGSLGVQHLRVAVLGENGLPRFASEVLMSAGAPTCSIEAFGFNETAYVKPFNQLKTSDYDCFILMGRNPEEAREIRALLGGVEFGVAQGKLLIDWNVFPTAVLSLLGKLEGLPTCLNYQKLFAIAAAVYLMDAADLVFECGVYKGGTTVFIGLLLNAFGKGTQVYALDTYQGLPAPATQDTAGGIHYPAGFFAETSLESVRELYRSYGLDSKLVPVAGLVGDTLPTLVGRNNTQCGFAFIDLDQYRGIFDAVNCLLKSERKLFALVDDTSIPGVDQAIRESCAGFRVHRTNIGYNLDVLSLNA